MTAKPNKQPVKHGYMDGVTFECELGADPNGSKIFPNRLNLLQSEGHLRTKTGLRECGIALVEVRLVRWIRKPGY